jgi:hypothetical protein
VFLKVTDFLVDLPTVAFLCICIMRNWNGNVCSMGMSSMAIHLAVMVAQYLFLSACFINLGTFCVANDSLTLSAFRFLLPSVVVLLVVPEELTKASISGCYPLMWPLIPPVPVFPENQMSCPQSLQQA